MMCQCWSTFEKLTYSCNDDDSGIFLLISSMAEVADFLNENNLLRFPNPIEIETQRQVDEEPLAQGTASVPEN